MRELTKVHEEKYYGNISTVLSRLKEKEIKGEIVIVLEGNKDGEETGPPPWEGLELEEHVRLLMAEGLGKKKPSKGLLKSGVYPGGKYIKRLSVSILGNS